MWRQSLRWALAMGVVGFAAGFFGPMALDPESNIGPIIGILFSGPGGAVIGAVLGAIFGLLPVSDLVRSVALTIACVVLALATLYECLPDPAVRGYVIDATVVECTSPTQRIGAATQYWDAAVARVTWSKPTFANWQEMAVASVRSAPGVVLTVRIERKRPILRHRRPWDRGESSAGPWLDAGESTDYYADDEGAACARYLARDRRLYWPEIDPNMDPMKPADVWPPTDALGFLSLLRLGPVPVEYQRLLEPG